MKKLSLLLAAALFALTACAPAVSTPADATPEDAPGAAAPAETAPAESAATAVTEALHTPSEVACSGNYLYQTATAASADGTWTGMCIYRTDLSTGQTALFYHSDTYQTSLYPLVTSDAVYTVAYDASNNSCLLAVPLDGGEAQVFPFDANEWSINLYSDNYLYCCSYDRAPYYRTSGMRLNLQTGESEPWDLPAETTRACVLGTADGAIVTERLISDSPVPFPDDPEISDAFLQNATIEFDLTDAATGKPVQKLWEVPCNGVPEGDGSIRYTYYGKSGSNFYFLGEHAQPSGNDTATISMSVLCVGSDGTQQDLGILNSPLRPICQGEEVRWFVAPNDDNATFTIYDLQGNVIGQSAAPDGAVVYYPQCFLEDGQLLLITGYDPQHDNARQLAIMDADTFLAGGLDSTAIAFAE